MNIFLKIPSKLIPLIEEKSLPVEVDLRAPVYFADAYFPLWAEEVMRMPKVFFERIS